MFAFIRSISLITLCLLVHVAVSAAPQPADTDASSTQQVSQSYKIGPGDVLRISVWKEEGMDQEILVKPDGGITFPLAGDIAASGYTTQDLTNSLVSKLKKYIPNPVVTVSVLQTVSNKIFVVGKVNRPGEFKATSYMDVLQALSLAGGVTPFAESDAIKIIRRDAGGRTKTFDFDYDEVVSGESMDMNIILEAGDTIVVP
jgi:polysaccharide export outer membrane protein